MVPQFFVFNSSPVGLSSVRIWWTGGLLQFFFVFFVCSSVLRQVCASTFHMFVCSSSIRLRRQFVWRWVFVFDSPANRRNVNEMLDVNLGELIQIVVCERLNYAALLLIWLIFFLLLWCFG
ncbi:LOW QUALITY PROTEIN: hypothetical protein V2J09_013413 [Rumex salicifolius]